MHQCSMVSSMFHGDAEVSANSVLVMFYSDAEVSGKYVLLVLNDDADMSALCHQCSMVTIR